MPSAKRKQGLGFWRRQKCKMRRAIFELQSSNKVKNKYFSTMAKFILLPTIAAALVAVWLGYFISKMHEMDEAYQKWNEDEWHIDEYFSRPAPFFRFINTKCFGDGSALLYFMRVVFVSPALNRVLELMETADKDEDRVMLPKILCNERARMSLTERVDEFYTDVKSSTTLTITAKLLLYLGSYTGLINHYGLLEMGMNAQVQNEVIKEPVFIVSPPRTATTILHRTMSLDRKRFKSFDFSEMTVPLPNVIPRWDEEGRRQKWQEGENFLREYEFVYPGIVKTIGSMHTLSPTEAEEDLSWLDHGLGHPYRSLFELYPEYRSKNKKKQDNDSNDVREDDGSWGIVESNEVIEYRYAWLSMIMKIHQHVDKNKWEERSAHKDDASTSSEHPTSGLLWIMKDPNHAPHLNELLAQFPHAKLIFIHRNPADIVTSLAKLYIVCISMDFLPGSRGSSAKEIGEEAVLRMKYYSKGMVDFTREQNSKPSSPYSLQQHGNSTSRIDLRFDDVVQDVPGSIAKIYQQFYPERGGPSVEAMKAMKNYLKQDMKEKQIRQRRSLEEFHLTKDDVAFTEYNQLFLS